MELNSDVILMGINEWVIPQASSVHSALSLRQLSRNSCILMKYYHLLVISSGSSISSLVWVA